MTSVWEAAGGFRSRLFKRKPAVDPFGSMMGWYCNECMGHVMESEGHWHCWSCSGYDLCSACHTKGLHSDCPLLTWETLHNFNIHKCISEAASRSLAHLMHTAFMFYAGRPFLGFSNPLKGVEDTPCYEWLSYQQVHLQSIRFGLGMGRFLSHDEQPASRTGARRLFGFGSAKATKGMSTKLSGMLLGICSRNCPEWVICDFGSALSGMVTAPIHTTFTLAQKRAVLGNSQLTSVLVGSRHRSKVTCGCVQCSPFVSGEGYELLEEF